MAELSDDDLLNELKARFNHTKQTLYDLKIVSRRLEEVNRKLQISEQVKSNFVSHMKNEINNPLSCILGLAQQLRSHDADRETVVGIAQSIFAEAFSLDFQLRNIFAAAELEDGATMLQSGTVDGHSLMIHAVNDFSHLILAKELNVYFLGKKLNIGSQPVNNEGEKLYFKSDSEKLELVVQNLLSNAIEFNNPGGRIDLDIGVVDDRLILSVTDTGVGLNPEQIERIFDRFTQLEAGVRKSHKGHGLGLSITKAVIDMMEGSVHVSAQPGEGCTVTLSIPFMETDAEADTFSVDGNEFFFSDDQSELF
ncbi:sensor histidine kinase [Candidatus Magnetaquicoccus inordinatus]|uniref:sensor histidine kinase n=1 Tax=Candidatus Magnetaquicoccus inordinatus TaxID=2496818 RepID=UPI00102AD4C3|nr:HAMP domain-containing sensor histidine kinase [Candidatus Magnetaquicoccus inordinatus]